MAPPVLTLGGVAVDFGGDLLLDGVDVSIAADDRVCLVGRNGSGKSTLLRIIAGLTPPDAGTRFVRPGTRVAYLEQEPDISPWPTVKDAILAALPADQRHEVYRAEALLDGLSLDGSASTARLSGGETRRVSLARTLVSEPEVLLLDEPTNHLDLPTIAWLEDRLAGFQGAFVLVSHDRAFLTRLARRTLWLDRGAVRCLDGGFDRFEAWSSEFYEREEAEQRRLDKLIGKETAWARRGIPARRKRNQGRLRKLYELRDERAAQRARVGQVRLGADEGIRSGKIVINAKKVSKAFGERTILTDLNVRLIRGDRLGIIGPNGAGKTTLLRILMGDLEPDSGNVRLGTNLEPLYIDQRRTDLDPDKTLWDTLANTGADRIDVRGYPKHVVAYLQDFLFTPDQARSPVGTLSGGERNRLLLAKHLARPSNLLILDEPTNDLDMETLDLLQEVLADYQGTLLLVSHDRDFLDRTVTSTLVLEGDGTAIEYAGGYTDYTRQKALAAKPAPEATTKPKETRPKATKVQTKLTWKQERALEELPTRIAALETEITGIEASLEDGGFYARDPEAFKTAADRLDPARTELAALEEQWLELEMLREELDAARS